MSVSFSGSGQVVSQVIYASSTALTSTTSSTLSSTGVSASITPRNSSNKVLCILSFPVFIATSGNQATAQINRNSGAATSGQATALGSGANTSGNINIVWLDSPATTSSTTYVANFASMNNSGTVTTNKDWNSANTGLTTLTLMEIAYA